MKLIRLIVCSGLLLVLACSSGQAATIIVPVDFGTIQGAIADAGTVNGDEIIVKAGIYPESINFLGKGITVRSSSGDPLDTIIDGTGFYHVVQCISGEDSNTVLEGFTIRRGEADGTPPDDNGGGMYNYHSSPTVTNCIFSDNHAKESSLGFGGEGGGMYNDASSPIVTDCMFELNSAERRGGGMYNYKSSPTLTNCTFSVNTSDIGSLGGEGGGIYNDYCNSTITGCFFIGNSAAFGGGILNSHSSPVVTDCIFNQNTVRNIGGGMYNRYDSSPTVTNCTFSNNSALTNGGGMTNYMDSNPTVTDCTFSGNSTAGHGGGMYNSINTATVTKCLFSSNIATISGGGMVNYGSNTIINQCKFIGNTAVSGGGIRNEFRASPFVTNSIFSHNIVSDGKGGGMSNYYRSNPVVANCTFSENEMTDNPTSGGGMSNEFTSSPTVINTIFWGNLPDQVYYDDPNSVRHISFSDVQGGSAGAGNIDIDPIFVSAYNDDLHLTAGSDAIDAGINGVPGGPLDLDGNNRFIDDPSTDDTGMGPGSIIDMGAYEFGVSLCLCTNGLVGDINCDGVVDLLDLRLMGVHWTETI